MDPIHENNVFDKFEINFYLMYAQENHDCSIQIFEDDFSPDKYITVKETSSTIG